MAEQTASTFPQAVASFEPTSTGVLLWTRLAAGTQEATWAIARDPSMEDVVQRGVTSASADTDHTITVSVEGLSPATTYWYRFDANGEGSPVGRTRTLPDHDVRSFRIATVVLCRLSRGTARGLPSRRRARGRPRAPPRRLHLRGRRARAAAATHDPPHVATTLDDYRRRIAQVRSDPDTQALHLRHPMVTIWDDHDLADNAWRDGAKAHDPAEHGPWPDRVAAAAHGPAGVAARPPAAPARSADHVAIGRHRRPGRAPAARHPPPGARPTGRRRRVAGPGRPEALAARRPSSAAGWRERLADDSRPWSVIASGVVVNEIELTWPPPLRWINALLPNGYAILDGRVLHDDQWDGYPAERARLGRGAAGPGRARWSNPDPLGRRPLVLGVRRALRRRGGEPVAVEVTTPAVSSAAMGRAHLPGMWRLLDRAANDLDHVRWAEVTERATAPSTSRLTRPPPPGGSCTPTTTIPPLERRPRWPSAPSGRHGRPGWNAWLPCARTRSAAAFRLPCHRGPPT